VVKVLHQEKEIPRRALSRPYSPGTTEYKVKLFRLIDTEKKAAQPTYLLCVSVVCRSGYYGWKDRPPSKRCWEDVEFTEKIRLFSRTSSVLNSFLETYLARSSCVRVAKQFYMRSSSSLQEHSRLIY